MSKQLFQKKWSLWSHSELVQHDATLELDIASDLVLCRVMAWGRITFRNPLWSTLYFVSVILKVNFLGDSKGTWASWRSASLSHQDSTSCYSSYKCSVTFWPFPNRNGNKRYFFCLYLWWHNSCSWSAGMAYSRFTEADEQTRWSLLPWPPSQVTVQDSGINSFSPKKVISESLIWVCLYFIHVKVIFQVQELLQK